MSNLPTFTEKHWDYNTQETQADYKMQDNTVYVAKASYDLSGFCERWENDDKLRDEWLNDPRHWIVYDLNLYMKQSHENMDKLKRKIEDNLSEENQKKIQKIN